jgi:endonuclease/exonuclease/phosphatase (EEP) superfamily protein YafD
VTANLLIGNRQRTTALTAIAHANCDLVVLIEATAADEAFFLADPRWPHRLWRPHEGLGGIAVLSRHPLTLVRVIEDRHPILLAAQALIAGAPVLVLACHPVAPESWVRTCERNAQFALIAQMAAAHGGPVVAAGDFNCSHAALAWSDFLATSQLDCDHTGPATFPAVLGPWGIAIDHVLVRSAVITALSVQIIPGSDHRGLRCDIAWPTTGSS